MDINILDIIKSIETSKKNYKTLESQLKGKKRSQILVITQNESIRGCPGIIPPKYIDPMFIGIDTYLHLGILTSAKINKSKETIPKIILSTNEYIEKHDILRNKWELKKGPIEFDAIYLENLGKEIERRDIPVLNLASDLKQGLLIHIGQEVEQYFNKRGGIISYVEGLDLLKQPVPENFRKEYNKIRNQQTINIIQKLEGLTSLESKIHKEIESIFSKVDRRPQLGGKVLYSTGPDLLGLTEDDAKIATIGKRKELEDIQGQIKNHLKQALELNINKTNLVLEGNRPGISINVPEYISKMCEFYKIELTK